MKEEEIPYIKGYSTDGKEFAITKDTYDKLLKSGISKEQIEQTFKNLAKFTKDDILNSNFGYDWTSGTIGNPDVEKYY